jgi:hypothetical protein
MATEGFIQFIWKHKLYDGKSLSTVCGEALEILNPGELNLHAGPDFFNARIRFGPLVWAGNVEIHLRASDWYRHGHHFNPAYNNVILHVVGEYDTDVTNSLGRRIHTLVPEYSENLLNRYKILKQGENWIACADYIGHLPGHRLKVWLGALHAERAAQKLLRIKQLFDDAAPNPDEVLYRALAQGYGIPLNSLPFELLAKAVPFKQLIEYRDSPEDLEAILFGHSGLLQPARRLGPYPSSLWNRYLELKEVFTEKPLPGHLWKFLRLRPPSFPTLRISQFASLIHNQFPLAHRLLETESLTEMEQLFRSGASEYWTSHYLFGKSSPPFPKFPGTQFVSALLINIINPFLFTIKTNEKKSKEGIQAGEFLQQFKAESNQIIKKWDTFGIRAQNALESQALIQLYNYYCKPKRCQDCQIGADLIKAAIHEKK